MGMYGQLFSLHKRIKLLIFLLAIFFSLLLIFLFGNRAISFSPLGYFSPVSPPKTLLPTQPTQISFCSSVEPRGDNTPAVGKESQCTEPPLVMQLSQKSARGSFESGSQASRRNLQ